MRGRRRRSLTLRLRRPRACATRGAKRALATGCLTPGTSRREMGDGGKRSQRDPAVGAAAGELTTSSALSTNRRDAA